MNYLMAIFGFMISISLGAATDVATVVQSETTRDQQKYVCECGPVSSVKTPVTTSITLEQDMKKESYRPSEEPKRRSKCLSISASSLKKM